MTKERTIEQLFQGGLVVLPTAVDGSKAIHAAFGKWGGYALTPPSPTAIVTFARHHPCGLSILCGAVSGNLMVVDVDEPSLVLPLREKLAASGYDGFPVVSTPSGGAHIYMRVQHTEKSSIMARTKEKAISIEIKGEKTVIVSPFFSAGVHPSGGLYSLIAGSFDALPLLSDDAWSRLKNIASSFDAAPAALPTPAGRPLRGDNQAGRHFMMASWEDILEPAGWHKVGENDNGSTWRRPCKDEGVSATVRMYGENEYFYSFSTNSEPFEAHRAYSKYACYALLHMRGDFKAAWHVSHPSLLTRIVR